MERLQELINDRNKTELARESKVSINQIVRISKHGSSPNLETAEKLLDAMGYRLNIVKGRRRK